MALTDLTTTGFIKYGTFLFNDAVTETVSLDITPQYDPGMRTVTHSVYDITLHSYLEGNPTDANVEDAVAQLTMNGRPFRYTGHGCGNLRVNVGERVSDVAWGPLVRVVSLKPLGAKRVCELTWRVSVSIPTCDDASYAFSPLAFSFNLSFDLAKNRFTTRRYQATLKIPNNRNPVGGRKMLDTPDAYRESIAPVLQPGFTRESESYVVDDTKTVLTATVVDQEAGPNYLPANVVVGSASHTYQSLPGKMGTAWTGTIEADFEIKKTADVTWAVKHFLEIVENRLASAADLRLGEGIPGAGIVGAIAGAVGRAAAARVRALPVAFSIAEPTILGPGGLRGKFSCTYLVSGTGLAGILRTGGLWNRVGDWRSWFVSVRDVMGPRGVAGLRFKADEDSIIDLCGKAQLSLPVAPPPHLPVAPPPRTPGTGTSLYTLPLALGVQAGIGAGIRAALGTAWAKAFPPPEAGEGWLVVRCSAEIEEDHGTVAAKTLPDDVLSDYPSGRRDPLWDALQVARPEQEPQGLPPYPPAADYRVGSQALSARGSEMSVQRRVTPTGFLTIRGHALRWARPIPCPEAVSTSGQTLTNCNRLETGEGFRQMIVGHALYPIYYAEWAMRYEATRAILTAGAFPVPPNSLG